MVRRQTTAIGVHRQCTPEPNSPTADEVAALAPVAESQVLEGGEARLFEGSDGYGDGEQLRDFVYVDDVAAVNLWLLDNPGVSGIFNVGTGRAQTFNDVARAVIENMGKGEIRYVDFPDHLRGRYQSFTEADISGLRATGYAAPFMRVEEGVAEYIGDGGDRA